MPTVTWARVDPARRAAVIEAAEAEFGAHGFSRGSLNVIARRAGVAKGSLFQYFADKRDLYAFIADIGSQRVRSYMEDLHPRARPEQAVLRISHRPGSTAGSPISPIIHTNVRCMRRRPWRSTPTPASACSTVIHRHYLEVLRPLVRDAQVRGDLRADADTDALLSLLLLIFPHLALAPYMRGLDPGPRARRAHTGTAGTGRAPARRGRWRPRSRLGCRTRHQPAPK